jgi:hypothetical protein
MIHFSKTQAEYLRAQAKEKFDPIRMTWIDCGRWAAPHRTKWLLSQVPGERVNQHIVDNTHTLALRSYVAGFLEGNTSATRPWFRAGTNDPEINGKPENKAWLQDLTRRSLALLSSGNFYNAAGTFYYDYGVFNTGAYYIEELKDKLFFHNLTPGSYYVLNNGYGEANVMVREFSLTVRALVDTYGKNGDWSNFSPSTRKMYEEGNYAQIVDVVHVVKENSDFDPEEPIASLNKKWLSVTYEVGTTSNSYLPGLGSSEYATPEPVPGQEDVWLNISASRRKPFIVGKSETSMNFEYGEKGPTLDSLGLIKSLNKKAIGKDVALEQMLRPPIQGPAKLRKSYVSTAPGSYVPLDAASLQQKGLRTIFEINPAIGALIQDVGDLRQQVDKLYYADFLLFLSQNPKTRTATEAAAVVQEQQLVIGPNLQSLNWTHNVPVVEYGMDYILDNDPELPDPPPDLAGKFIKPDFISIFAQAQRAADLPSIDKYMAAMANVAQIDPRIWDKVNVDEYADLVEDRLYVPTGLNNPTSVANAKREQAQAEAQKKQQLEAMTQMAGAAKDVGIQVPPQGGEAPQ